MPIDITDPKSIPSSRQLKNRLTRLLNAHTDYINSGSQHVEDMDVIEEDYERQLSEFIKLIDILKYHDRIK